MTILDDEYSDEEAEGRVQNERAAIFPRLTSHTATQELPTGEHEVKHILHSVVLACFDDALSDGKILFRA